ncbi:MAG: tail fiber protein [Neisseria sp.]|nr:tail fiber protein [Neisseria sp.]
MAQANKYIPQTSFASDVRTNKPGREAVNPGALDAEFRHIRMTANGLVDNLAKIQRDDGKLKDAAVDVHTLHRDVLMLLGKYELIGEWTPNRPYLEGYVVDYGGRLYVCIESHDANDAIDLDKFKAFGSASSTLTGDYLPVNFSESFMAADADSLTEAGVYILNDNGALSYLFVLGKDDSIGQLRIGADGLAVRFQTASGWSEWGGVGGKAEPDTLDEDSENSISDGKHTHKLQRADTSKAGIVKLGHDYGAKSEDVAASLKAVADALDESKEFASSQIIKTLGTMGGGGGSGLVVSDVPVGALMYFDMEQAPEGYLVADGSEQSQEEYPELYAAIGDRYGTAAAGKFKLPDGRAEFIRGLDMGRGVDVGRVAGSTQAGTSGRHYHGTSAVYMSGSAYRNIGFPVNFWDDGTETASEPPDALKARIGKTPWISATGVAGESWYRQSAAKQAVAFGVTLSNAAAAGVNTSGQASASLRLVTTNTHNTGKYLGGTISSLDIPADAKDGGSDPRPRNLAMLLCIKAVGGSGMLASEERAGLTKLYQKVVGDGAIDGAVSSKGVKDFVGEAVKWENLPGKPSTFTPSAHTHQWSDIQGAPEWVLKSVYDEKIAALEERLAKLENPSPAPDSP